MAYTLTGYFKRILKPLPLVGLLPALALSHDYKFTKDQQQTDLIISDFGRIVQKYAGWLEDFLVASFDKSTFDAYILPVFATPTWLVALIPPLVIWTLFSLGALVDYFRERELAHDIDTGPFSRESNPFRYKRK